MKEHPHYHGHRQRLRERLAGNPRELADYEVLELLLGYALPRRDTKPLAKELLRRFGTLRGVFLARPGELREVEGFGPGLESYVDLWKEFWSRLHEAPVQEKQVLGSPQAVWDMAMARLGHLSSEEVWLAMVDNKNRLLAWKQVSRGTVDETPVYPREVLAMALEHKASGIILVHNHPGGDPTPSTQDVELTRVLVRAAHDLGVRLLDHLIVSEKDYYSFQAKGLL